jgi:hypothetical protein
MVVARWFTNAHPRGKFLNVSVRWLRYAKSMPKVNRALPGSICELIAARTGLAWGSREGLVRVTA